MYRMRTVSFLVEFTYPVLANNDQLATEPNAFYRDEDGKVVMQRRWWHAAVVAASAAAPFDIVASDLLIGGPVDVVTTRMRRKHSTDAGVVEKEHECIASGSVVRIHAEVADRVDDTLLRDVLSYVGTHIGISPFGYKQGFGRFKILGPVTRSEL